MKKTLALILILAMTAMTFISCIGKTTTVTREEWENAFDFSTYGNFVYTINEFMSENKTLYTVKGSIESKDGDLYRNIEINLADSKRKIADNLEDQALYLENNSNLLNYIMTVFKKSASFGYSMFEYKEDSKSYYSKLDIIEIPCDINIWFEDGKIIKITLKGYKEFYEIDATYSFSFE